MSRNPLLVHRRRPCQGAEVLASDSWMVRAATCPTAVEGLVADTAVQIYVNLGPGSRSLYEVDEAKSPNLRRGWVVGPRTKPLAIRKETRDSDIVAVRLHPAAAGPALGVPAHELTNRLVDLEALWGTDVEGLRERLAITSDPDRRLAILEREVLRRGAEPAAGEAARRARALCSELGRRAGPSIGQVAERFGLTHRRAIESMTEQVGLRPAEFRRVQRFQAALAAVAHGAGAWTTVAHTAGYADQSHMIREFVRLAGMTPTEYLRRRNPVMAGAVRLVLAS